ncbi:MAG TPA: HepT-like ribonuclease domain-containing protein [Fimbriimonadaceae bacterium]|jgi:uncharacterized protein with HEPN domain
MQPKAKAALADIDATCAEILDYVGSDPEILTTDRIRALAVERLILIIGEALIRIRDSSPEVLDSITHWKAIVGMRNAIVHGYDTIDPMRIKDAVKIGIPLLQDEVRKLRS